MSNFEDAVKAGDVDAAQAAWWGLSIGHPGLKIDPTEKYDPEFKAFMVKSSSTGEVMIKHPLMVELILPPPTVANLRLKDLRRNFDEDFKQDRFVALHRWITRPFRLEFLRRWYLSGQISRQELAENIASVWSDAEPNDTDRRWLSLWKNAARIGRVEDEPLPEGDPVVIYRGQPKGARFGIAWSLDQEIAKFFAQRFGTKDVIYEANVARKNILGYIQDRKESEIIVDPHDVLNPKIL